VALVDDDDVEGLGRHLRVVSHLNRLVGERGQQDWDSEYGRFPRLFQDAGSIPGLTWPTLTFEGEMSIYLGKREVRLMQLGAGHTSGDIVAWVPDAEVMFSGDLIEYHSACYCGDAHLREWPATLNEIRAFNPKAIAPGRGDALKGVATGRDAIAMTRDFVTTLFGAAETAVAKGRDTDVSNVRENFGQGRMVRPGEALKRAIPMGRFGFKEEAAAMVACTMSSPVGEPA